MARGNRIRVGDNYLIDQITGEQIWFSESVVDYYGRRTHRRNADPQNPQEMVRTRPERAPIFSSSREIPEVCATQLYVGVTTVPNPSLDGPASNYIVEVGGGDVGVGQASIGCGFIVR